MEPESAALPVVLAIAATDAAGCAGLAVDLKVIAALGAHGAFAVTAVSAQGVSDFVDMHSLEASLIAAQIRAVTSSFVVGAVKVGALGSPAAALLVAEAVRTKHLPAPVVDPVLAASSGGRLCPPDAWQALVTELLPIAALVTPNIAEARELFATALGERCAATLPLESGPDIERAAARLHRALGCPVLLKGGHLPGEPVDVLAWQPGLLRFAHPRVSAVFARGTGCMLSSAIATRLAQGAPLDEACRDAGDFVYRALRDAQLVAATARLPRIRA